jgi:hypothetical protein
MIASTEEVGALFVQLAFVAQALVAPIQLVVCPKDGKIFKTIKARHITKGRMLIFIGDKLLKKVYNSKANAYIAIAIIFG